MNVTATLFGQMITFIVFVWFIKAYLWEPLTDAMESRTKKISDGLAAAEQGLKKIEQATIEFSTRIDEAKTKAAGIITNEESKSKAIKLSLEDNKLNLSVESQSKGSANEILDISYDGDKVDIGFNSKYIIDICNEVDGEEVDISLLDSVSPAIILDKTDENLFFVLMPMRI